MKQKKPIQFLPPDDPTAVYPIRTVQEEPEPESDVSLPEPDASEPLVEGLGFALDLTAETPLPPPSSSSAAGRLNKLVLVAFLAGGMMLAAGIVLVFAIGLILLQ